MITWLCVIFIWLSYHRLFELWGTFAMFRPLHLCTLAIAVTWLFSAGEKRPLGNISTMAIFAYMFAITLSALFSPFTNIFCPTCYHWLIFLSFFVVLMTSIKDEKDLKIVVSGLSVTMFLLMAHAYKAYLNGAVVFNDGVPRLPGGNATYRDVNLYGTLIACTLPLILPLLTLCKKFWHYLFVLGYLLLALRSIQLTGSRTAFIMAAMLFVLPVCFSRYRFKIFPLILIAMPLCWYSMEEVYKNRFRTIWDSTINENANRNKEGRLEGLYAGLINWSHYPLTGVGPLKHAWGPGGDQHFLSHNLYGQVAGETGTLGIITFLFLLLCFGINHYSIWKNYKYLQEKNLGKEGLYCWRVSLAIMYAVIMLLFQGLGLHSAYDFVWPLFTAFQALAAMIMQEKVDAVIQGKLRPSSPVKTI